MKGEREREIMPSKAMLNEKESCKLQTIVSLHDLK